MNKYVFLLVVMATLLILAPIIKPSFEGFSLNNAGIYPQANDVPILVNEYPYTGSKTVSNKDASQIWIDYPVFQLGSY